MVGKVFWEGATITAAQTEMDNLIPLIIPLRTADKKLQYARVSDESIRGDSLPSILQMPRPGSYLPPTGAKDLEVNSAILVQLFADSRTKNHWFLRGLTTSKIIGREEATETVWDTAFDALGTHLTSGTYKVKHKSSAGPPPVYVYAAITAVNSLRATARKPGRPFGTLRGRR